VVTDEGGYGRFGVLSRVELERFFYLDDEDRRLIAARRRDYNRLGFALQVVTVRQLGMFLADPLDVPPELIDYLAEQLGIVVGAYGDGPCVPAVDDAHGRVRRDGRRCAGAPAPARSTTT
jgi:hypothetical protein